MTIIIGPTNRRFRQSLLAIALLLSCLTSVFVAPGYAAWVLENQPQSERETTARPRIDTVGEQKITTAEVLAIIVVLSFVGLIVYMILKIPEGVELKEALKDFLRGAIQNGADLRAVKQIYSNRGQMRDNSFALRTSTTHYPMSVPLSVVLEDIRADVFLKLDSEKDVLVRLDDLIAEHSRINPFDQLEPTQKDQFERLREKLGERYDAVQLEITKIADELSVKNSLTQRYLRKSTISYWVSIAGLIFSLLIGLVQIYQWVNLGLLPS